MGNNDIDTNDQASELRKRMEARTKANRIVADMDCRFVFEARDVGGGVFFVNTEADPDVGACGRKISPTFAELTGLYKWIIDNEAKIQEEMLDAFRRTK